MRRLRSRHKVGRAKVIAGLAASAALVWLAQSHIPTDPASPPAQSAASIVAEAALPAVATPTSAGPPPDPLAVEPVQVASIGLAPALPPAALPSLMAAWQASGLPAAPEGWLEVYAQVVSTPCARLELEGASDALRLRAMASDATAADQLGSFAASLLAINELKSEAIAPDDRLCPLLDLLNRATLASPAPLARLEMPVEKDCPRSPCYAGVAAGRLQEGEQLVLAVTSPPIASHLTVDFVLPDGQVTRLYPTAERETTTPAAGTGAVPAGEGMWIGDSRAGPAFTTHTVAAPFGRGYILVIAAPTPLLAHGQPGSEPLDQYLATLTDALAAQSGPARPLVSLLAIDTHPATL